MNLSAYGERRLFYKYEANFDSSQENITIFCKIIQPWYDACYAKLKRQGHWFISKHVATHKSSLNVWTTIFSQREPETTWPPSIKTDFLRLIICVQKVRRLILQSGGDARIITPASFYSVKLPRHPAGKCLISNNMQAI